MLRKIIAVTAAVLLAYAVSCKSGEVGTDTGTTAAPAPAAPETDGTGAAVPSETGKTGKQRMRMEVVNGETRLVPIPEPAPEDEAARREREKADIELRRKQIEEWQRAHDNESADAEKRARAEQRTRGENWAKEASPEAKAAYEKSKKLLEIEREYGKNPFLIYYYNMLVRKYSLPAPYLGEMAEQWRPHLPRDFAGFFELTSGATAIETALQQETMKHEGMGVCSGERKVPVSTLKGPEIKPHDFKKMMGDRKVPDAPKSAALVPNDWAYATFPSINQALDFFDYMNDWGGSVLKMASVDSETGDMKDRIMTALGLKVNKMMRPFYGLAVGEFALAASDPYVIEGTDLAVWMEVRSFALFDKNTKSNLDKIREEIPGCKDGTVQIEGVEVAFTKSADGRVSSYRARIGDYAVFASSEIAMKQILACSAKKAKSVSENLDFQYLLTMNYKPECGYFYIGDDFVCKMIDPAFKIAELRRVTCWSEMKIVRYALSAYKLENGGKSAPLDAVIAGKFLNRMPECPDNGAYTLDPETGDVACFVHGHINALTHISAIPVVNVTSIEASLFREFADNYYNYYRHYIDPIGISIDVTKGVCLNVMILPILEEDAYRELLKFSGGKAVELSVGKFALDKYPLNLGIKARYLNAADRPDLPEQFWANISAFSKECGWSDVDNRSMIDWVGPDISLHMPDIDIEEYLGKALFGRGGPEFENIPPMFLRIQVIDEPLAEKFISHILNYAVVQNRKYQEYHPKDKITISGPDKIDGGKIFKLHSDYEEYDYGRDYSREPKKVMKSADFFIGLSEKSAFVSMKSSVVEECMAAEKAGKTPADKFWDEPLKKSVAMLFFPKKLKLLGPYIDRMIEVLAYQSCGDKRYNLKMASDILTISGLPVSEAEILKSGILDAIPKCPDGGAYAFDNGSWTCTLHKPGLFVRKRNEYRWSEGFNWEPSDELKKLEEKPAEMMKALPPLPASSPLKQLLESLDGIEASLQFTEDGISTTVRLVKNPPKIGPEDKK